MHPRATNRVLTDNQSRDTLDCLFVTGSNGLLGANLVVSVVNQFPIVASALSSPVPTGNHQVILLDITNTERVERIISSVRPSVVIHCAAETRVDHCEEHPEVAMRVNVDGTINLSRAAATVGALMTYISTDSVFNGCRGTYTEEDKTCPINVYARSKLLGEEAVRSESAEHLIIRTNIFGWNFLPKESLSEWVLGRLHRSEEVPGFTDVVFSPLLVNDLADILLSMIKKQLRGTYHVGSHDHVNKFQFAKQIARVFGLDSNLVQPTLMSSTGFKARRPRVTTLDVSRIEQMLGYPMPKVEEGLYRFRRLQDNGYAKALRVYL